MTQVLERPGSTNLAPGGPATSGPAMRPRTWIGFAAVLAAMIMNLLDSTIVNVAAPAIQSDLGLSDSALEWIAAAYTLAIAVGLMTGGRLGDRFGRKQMLMIGLIAFVTTSVACAVAWSPEALVTARVLQGLSAALVTPQCFGLIREIFGPANMGKACAALGPVIGLSTVAGPAVAGLLMDWNVLGTGWRALFLINVPIGVFALLVGARVLPAGRRSDTVRLDARGTVLLAVVAFLLVFPIVDGRTLGWPAWIFGVLAAAVPMLALFVAQQRRRVASGRSPLFETSVLRKRSYVSGVVFVLVFFAAIVGFGLTVGLFLQLGLGFSPLKAALLQVALSVGAFLGSGVGAWAATAVGRPILHVGLAIMAVGTLVLFFCLRGSGGDVGWLTLTPGLGVFGLGMGMIFVPLFSIVLGEIDDHEVGSASGLLESLQQLGASLGVAVLATLFFARFDGGHATGSHSTVAAQDTLLVTLGLVGLAFALGWLLPRRARAMQ